MQPCWFNCNRCVCLCLGGECGPTTVGALSQMLKAAFRKKVSPDLEPRTWLTYGPALVWSHPLVSISRDSLHVRMQTLPSYTASGNPAEWWTPHPWPTHPICCFKRDLIQTLLIIGKVAKTKTRVWISAILCPIPILNASSNKTVSGTHNRHLFDLSCIKY